MVGRIIYQVFLGQWVVLLFLLNFPIVFVSQYTTVYKPNNEMKLWLNRDYSFRNVNEMIKILSAQTEKPGNITTRIVYNKTQNKVIVYTYNTYLGDDAFWENQDKIKAFLHDGIWKVESVGSRWRCSRTMFTPWTTKACL